MCKQAVASTYTMCKQALSFSFRMSLKLHWNFSSETDTVCMKYVPYFTFGLLLTISFKILTKKEVVDGHEGFQTFYCPALNSLLACLPILIRDLQTSICISFFRHQLSDINLHVWFIIFHRHRWRLMHHLDQILPSGLSCRLNYASTI